MFENFGRVLSLCGLPPWPSPRPSLVLSFFLSLPPNAPPTRATHEDTVAEGWRARATALIREFIFFRGQFPTGPFRARQRSEHRRPAWNIQIHKRRRTLHSSHENSETLTTRCRTKKKESSLCMPQTQIQTHGRFCTVLYANRETHCSCRFPLLRYARKVPVLLRRPRRRRCMILGSHAHAFFISVEKVCCCRRAFRLLCAGEGAHSICVFTIARVYTVLLVRATRVCVCVL